MKNPIIKKSQTLKITEVFIGPLGKKMILKKSFLIMTNFLYLKKMF